MRPQLPCWPTTACCRPDTRGQARLSGSQSGHHASLARRPDPPPAAPPARHRRARRAGRPGPAGLPESRPDEISTTAAATLLGLTPRRLRQLADEGFVVVHARGRTTVSSCVQGYIKSLRASGHSTEASASAARGHNAKAALIRSATAKRRAALTAQEEAITAIETVAQAAIRRLTEAPLPAAIPAPAGTSFRSELALAVAQIEAAKARALAALASGDLSKLDGQSHG